MIAIITAAGWKGAGRERGLPEVPECFLPLGDGTTTLSRMATGLSSLGFSVHIAVAPLGYPFSAYWPKFMLDDLPESPWTQEILDYAGGLGTLIEIENPGRSGSHDTICKAMGMIPDNWERLFIARGDMLLQKGGLQKIVSRKWPAQHQLCPNHSFFMFDKKTATIYLEYMKQFTGEWSTRAEWWGNGKHQYWPDGHPQGTQAMKERGLPVHWSDNPVMKWADVDSPATYTNAIGIVEHDV